MKMMMFFYFSAHIVSPVFLRELQGVTNGKRDIDEDDPGNDAEDEEEDDDKDEDDDDKFPHNLPAILTAPPQVNNHGRARTHALNPHHFFN